MVDLFFLSLSLRVRVILSLSLDLFLSLCIVILYFFALIGEEGFLISPCYSLDPVVSYVSLSLLNKYLLI